MGHIEGSNRNQRELMAASLDDRVSMDHPIRVIDAFAETLDLRALGFLKVVAQEMGLSALGSAEAVCVWLFEPDAVEPTTGEGSFAQYRGAAADQPFGARQAMHERTIADPTFMKHRRELVEHPFGIIKWMLGAPASLSEVSKKPAADSPSPSSASI